MLEHFDIEAAELFLLFLAKVHIIVCFEGEGVDLEFLMVDLLLHL